MTRKEPTQRASVRRQLQRRIRQQKINPIQGEKGHDGAANKCPLARGQSRNAQAWPVHEDNGERIDVEKRQRAIKKEGERVPLKCCDEMGVKKCGSRSRRTAGQARVAGQYMKQTDWPWQSQREPHCRQGHPARGNTQPKQFVIGLARSKWPANDLHDSRPNDDLTLRVRPAWTKAQTQDRSRRSEAEE
jgi:hypothetical protein